MKNKIIFFIILISFFSCDPLVKPTESEKPKVYYNSQIIEEVIPEVYTNDGGIQGSGSGSVYYFTDGKNRDLSDVQLDDSVFYSQNVKRYIKVSGKALPIASGFIDRTYHSVLFRAIFDATTDFYFSIPVDSNNVFTGFIYFPKKGSYKVYSFRAMNDLLYSIQGKVSSVAENNSTLVFNVNVIEEVPEQFHYLLPTRNVNNGNKEVRDYAKKITAGKNTNFEKVKALYEFLVFGEDNNPFIYSPYQNINQNLTTISYEDTFIASHFLNTRKGVCNDFAELFAAMVRSLNIKVQKRSGTKYDNTAHMWNLVDLTGDETVWLRIDSTFGNTFSADENYKKSAEIYPEFNSTDFTLQHDSIYNMDLKQNY